MVRTSNDPLDFTDTPARRPPQPPARHPLGLPAGSIRAVLTLMVAGLIWALVLHAGPKVVELPLYLLYLMFLIVGSYFAAHGNSIAAGQSPEPSPWHLPRGSVRFLVLAGFAAVIAWRFWKYGELPEVKVPVEDAHDHAFLILWIMGGFFSGMLLSRLVGGVIGAPTWYQDVLAWLSLVAVLGLAIEVVILLIINPSVGDSALNLPKWQTFLAATISLYFGARS